MNIAQDQENMPYIHFADMLLNEAVPAMQIAERLSRKFSKSKVEAYQYIKQAKEAAVATPDMAKPVKLVVRIQPYLLRMLNSYAGFIGSSPNEVTSLALAAYLSDKHTGEIRKAS